MMSVKQIQAIIINMYESIDKGQSVGLMKL